MISLLAQSPSVFNSTHHLLVLGISVCIVCGFVVYGRRGPDQQQLVAQTLGVIGVGIWVMSGVFYSIPPHLKPHESLPIQACDLLALITAITMLRPTRLLRAVTYFGAFGLTLQAFITPVINTGPDTFKFYVFWLLHASIIFCALFDLLVRGFRPNAKDLGLAVVFWGIYGVMMVILNWSTGWYYGYLGPTIPPNAEGTILKYLGPWPIRPLSIFALAGFLFFLLWLPWWGFGRRRKKAEPEK